MSARPLPAAAVAAVIAWCALLFLAPPDSNLFWAVNGFRSIALPAKIAVACAALVGLGVVLRPATFTPAAAVLLVVLLAAPFREGFHLSGDTQLRVRLLEDLAAGHGSLLNFMGFHRVLHARWLDALLNVTGVGAIARAGVPVPVALALAGVATLLACAAAMRRIVERAAPASDHAALTAAALLAGTLQVFAGYADVWGLALAVAAWWWAMLCAPLDRPRRAVVNVALWLALLLTHRAGLLLIPAQLWRGLGPAFAGDTRASRRLHTGLSLAAITVGAMLNLLAGTGVLGRDVSDFMRSTLGGPPRMVSPWDLANLALVALPLAVAAPWLAGRAALGRFVREPVAPLLAAALVPLLPMILVFPAAPHGLGAQRDWDLAALFGLIATAGAVVVLARTPEARRRVALALVVPLLAVQALSWTATQADPRVAERRAEVIVAGRFGPRAEQRSHALVFLAYRAARLHDYARAARRFERAAELLPNPRHPLLAAQCWILAGEPVAARRAYDRAVAQGPLDPYTRETAGTVLRMIRDAEAGMPPHVREGTP